MSTPKKTVWPADPHTLAKHEILKRYLGAWFPILASNNSRVVYIDGFCGPGRYENGEVGSPIIALREALKSSGRLNGSNVTFLFMDEREDRIDHLKKELQGFPIPQNFCVTTTTGKFDTEISELLDDLDSKELRLAPTFAFVDPFGFKGVPFSLLSRLLQNRKTEVLVNVMVDAINRFLEHQDANIIDHITKLFGTDQVIQIAKSEKDRIAQLRLLYQSQLQKSAKFVRFFEMQNDRGRTIYYLFFASNHPLGHVKMKEAFWKVDPTSGFVFSDATNPDQPVLFQMDWTNQVANLLCQQFISRRVAVTEIRQFVENETSFVSAHMRDALKLLENESRIVVELYKSTGEKRRRNSFPDEVVLQFPE